MPLLRPTRGRLLLAAALIATGVCPVAVAESPWASAPCQPHWLHRWPRPIVGEPAGDVAAASRTSYTTLLEFPVTSEVQGIYFDAGAGVHQVVVGDYPNDRVVRHTVDAGLTVVAEALPVTYGQAWALADLDLDGQPELILQRGDPGMGGNGYVDILSAPDWTLRAHIVLAGMKVYCTPMPFDLDGDPYLELYVTPSSLSGYARALVVDYDPAAETFVVRDDISMPSGSGGPSAIGDFDGDGRVEIFTGNGSIYSLLEYGPEGLSYVTPFSGLLGGTNACALRPLPDHALCALLGHSSFSNGFTYQLLRATADNTFTLVHVFQEETGYAGVHPCYGLDADNDGLDEITMKFHPLQKVFGWDPDSGDFTEVWAFDEIALGTLLQFGHADFDQDGVREWTCVNHLNQFRAFEDGDALPSGLDAPAPVAGVRLRVCNPSVGPARIHLEAAAVDRGPWRLALIDASGRILRSWQLAGPATLAWDGADDRGRPLAPGLYWLRAWSSRDLATTRLIRF